MTIAEQFAPRVASDFHGSLPTVVKAAEYIFIGARTYSKGIRLETIEQATQQRKRVTFVFGDGSWVVAP